MIRDSSATWPDPAMHGDRIVTWQGDAARRRDDAVAVEEPLEIRLAGGNVAVTMRTPGHDADLALGFLLTEGIIRDMADVHSVAHCDTDDPAAVGNVINVNPTDPSLADPARWQRNFYATSSCGICGKASIQAVRQQAPPLPPANRLAPRVLYRLERVLAESQTAFGQTGGLHAAGLFDAQGRLIIIHEDVGRHNAVDKVVGEALRRGMLPLHHSVLLVSGRASFEIVQKALMAGIPLVAAVSAPSSLAIELAREAGMTLVGFLRGEGSNPRLNVYAGEEGVGPEITAEPMTVFPIANFSRDQRNCGDGPIHQVCSTTEG